MLLKDLANKILSSVHKIDKQSQSQSKGTITFIPFKEDKLKEINFIPISQTNSEALKSYVAPDDTDTNEGDKYIKMYMVALSFLGLYLVNSMFYKMQNK